MTDRHELDDISKQVGLYFDHVLSMEDEKAFLSRVEEDPAFHRVFSKEKSIRESLKKHVHRPGVPPDLVQMIKEKIRIS